MGQFTGFGFFFVNLSQTVNAAHAGRNQEQVGAHPGCRGGEAGRRIAKHRYKDDTHHGAGDHLHHARQNGQTAEAHTLDGETDNVHQGQREEKGGEGADVLGGQIYQGGKLRLGGVQEEHGPLGRKEQHAAEGDQRIDEAQQRAGPHALAQAVQLDRAHILAAVGGHGGTHGVVGTAQQLEQLASRSHTRHIEAAQAVDGGLEEDGADGGDGVLKPHGYPHKAQGPAGTDVQLPLLPAHVEDGELFHHVHQAGQAGHSLGQYGGQRGSRHPQPEHQDKGQVQANVQH